MSPAAHSPQLWAQPTPERGACPSRAPERNSHERPSAAGARIVKAAGDVQAAWARTKLRAERRWGELLGAPRVGANQHGAVTPSDSSTSTSADRMARQRVRQVAAVPEEEFEGFLQREDPKHLTRATLLREHKRRGPALPWRFHGWLRPLAHGALGLSAHSARVGSA